jgi:hypothetical protein
MDGEATKKQQQHRESEEAKKRERMWESDESSESESEDEEKRRVDILAKIIIESKNHQNREEEIMDFLVEWLYTRIYNMEISFGRREARKDEKKKYERAKEALEILDEHYEMMMHVMDKAAEYEEMEMEMEEASVGDDENEEYNSDDEHDDEDDDMEVDFMSIEVRKSGGGKA